jgi:hypothetical protein
VVFLGLGRTDNVMDGHLASLRVINRDTVLDCHSFTLHPGRITGRAFYSMTGSRSLDPMQLVAIQVREIEGLAARFQRLAKPWKLEI